MQSLFLVPEQFPQLARALDEGRWVVACLCAAWCDVCKQYRPGFEGLAAEYPEQQFVWIDIEDQADLIGDLDGTVRRILATVSAEAAEIPAPQTKQQSDSSSRDWIDRFLAERPQHRHRAGG